LCERRPAGREGCASGIGCGLRGKIEWRCREGLGERRDRRLGEAARHSVGHWATAGKGCARVIWV
jgi:hypothetical protein